MQVQITSQRLDWKVKPVAPRTKAFNASYVPGWWGRISFLFAFSKGGGDKPIERRKLSWTSKAKIGSLEKANHRPGGGQVANSWRIIDNWIGFLLMSSLPFYFDQVKIENQKLDWNVTAKVSVHSDVHPRINSVHEMSI